MLRNLDPAWWIRVDDGYQQQERVKLTRVAHHRRTTGWALQIDGVVIARWPGWRLSEVKLEASLLGAVVETWPDTAPLTPADAFAIAWRMIKAADLSNGRGEVVGRVASTAWNAIVALLDAYFPRRHEYACPACGRREGLPCIEPYATDRGSGFHERAIPHEARRYPARFRRPAAAIRTSEP